MERCTEYGVRDGDMTNRSHMDQGHDSRSKAEPTRGKNGKV